MRLSIAIIVMLAVIAFMQNIKSQDLESIIEELDTQRTIQELPAPFFSTIGLIQPTVRTLPKRVFDFRVAHNFGKVAGGWNTFFGLAYATDVKIGISYGLFDEITVSFNYYRGTWIAQRLLEWRVKAWLLKQRKGKSPLHLSVFGNITYVAGNVNPYQAGEQPLSLRLSPSIMLLIARQFGKFTFQISPYYIFSLRGPVTHNGSFFGIGYLIRFRVIPIAAILVEGAYTFNPAEPDYYVPTLAAGVNFVTGGHVFSIRFVNSRALLHNFAYPYSTATFSDLRFSFYISRVFSFGYTKKAQSLQ